MIASTVDQYSAFAADVRATLHDPRRAWKSNYGYLYPVEAVMLEPSQRPLIALFLIGAFALFSLGMALYLYPTLYVPGLDELNTYF